jgi:Domain of unknown function DUF11
MRRRRGREGAEMHSVVRSRVLLAAAVGLGIAALAATAVMAETGGGAGTVLICHSDGGGNYTATTAPKTDFYGTLSGHGTHADDIVPPFTIDNPGPNDPSSYDGRNWGVAGQLIYNRGCASVPQENPEEPSKKVEICHATDSHTNPYVSEDPAIGDNGDLQGGHLNHTGPVFPADNWGDIIPPYDYIDQDGKLQTFPGYNWTEEGQAIYHNGCDPPAPPQPKPLIPILRCVEATNGGLLAHFGFENPNTTTIEPPASENFFSPDPADRGQPTSFGTSQGDVVQVNLNGGAVTWHLTGNQATATAGSPRCSGSITVNKQLLPTDDPGVFSLMIDGKVHGGAFEVGNGGTTGTIAVAFGTHTVSEVGAAETVLDKYQIQIVCLGGGGTGEVVAEGNGPSLEVKVAPAGPGAEIVCTITNQRKQEAKDVTPTLQCVVFRGGTPSFADWGYSNTSGVPVVIPIGTKNQFTPSPAYRNQPISFAAGAFTGVFQTAFGAGETALTWTLSGHTLTADASSPRCTATVELQKEVVPADDPGVFNLQINGHTLATGGNGTTTGPLTVGVGEGTASETAGPGTKLSDYDSSVVCARNGKVEVSVPGTKVDGAVANGDVVVCKFTNVRHGTPVPPKPPNPEPPTPTPPGPNPPDPIPPPPPGPAPLLDLEVVKTGKPASVLVGGKITWRMTVTNRSSVAAADVNGLKVNDPRSFRTKLISLTTSQGSCHPFVCDLGRLAPGASATVVAVTRALEVGPVVDVVRVGSEEIESNYRNNVASALVRVIGALRPPIAPKICRTLTAAPRVLQAERASVVLLTARNRLGHPLVGLPIRIRGAGVLARARTGRLGIARLTVAPTRAGLILFAGGRRTVVHRPTCITLLAALRARPTHVTG